MGRTTRKEGNELVTKFYRCLLQKQLKLVFFLILPLPAFHLIMRRRILGIVLLDFFPKSSSSVGESAVTGAGQGQTSFQRAKILSWVPPGQGEEGHLPLGNPPLREQEEEVEKEREE